MTRDIESLMFYADGDRRMDMWLLDLKKQTEKGIAGEEVYLMKL